MIAALCWASVECWVGGSWEEGVDGLAGEGGSGFSVLVLLLGRMRDRRAAGRPMVGGRRWVGGCVSKGGVNKVDAGRLRALRGVVREGHPVNATRSGE